MKSLAAALALALPLCGQDALLEWMNRTAQKQLEAREAAIARITTRAAAEARQAQVRVKILELIGGLPDYAGPLNPRVTGTLDRGDHWIEKVIFESLPRYYISANLYRPKTAGRHPGVLFALGHWPEGKSAVQQIAVNLAKKGFVVLAYDPMGQGERLQAYDPRLKSSLTGIGVEQHILAGGQALLAGETFARYRIFDAKRALDYLVSRPEVDASAIGCTGCSGGGTVTTYISALDARIKVAVPACYINTFHYLFPGPTGDSEQSVPGFLAAGLDLTDYVELFAPKPYLIVSTSGDFFPVDGARHVFEEARGWWRLFGAEERVAWAVGPGGHGTPREVRERLYEWMIRWLKDGQGDPRDEPVEILPPHLLLASEGGQVGGRETWEILRDNARARQSDGSREAMVAELRKMIGGGEGRPPAARAAKETNEPDFRVQELAFEVDAGLDVKATLYVPHAQGRKPAVLLVNGRAVQAALLARRGAVVLSLEPRSSPLAASAYLKYPGDWITNTRAWLIGLNLFTLRAGDIQRGIDWLAARPDVQPGIAAAARDLPGYWLLAAAAVDPRLSRVWLDKTPASVRSALDGPVHRNLHDAIVSPGFALRWELADLRHVLGPRLAAWSDPTDWLGNVTPNLDGFTYRGFEESDDRFAKLLVP